MQNLSLSVVHNTAVAVACSSPWLILSSYTVWAIVGFLFLLNFSSSCLAAKLDWEKDHPCMACKKKTLSSLNLICCKDYLWKRSLGYWLLNHNTTACPDKSLWIRSQAHHVIMDEHSLRKKTLCSQSILLPYALNSLWNGIQISCKEEYSKYKILA